MRTERRDTALLATVASKLRWRYRYSVCDCLTKPDVASPVLDETVSKVLQGSAGLYGRTFFFFTITILKQSVIMSQSHVQWRNPLRMECTTCLVCPCLPYSFNLIHDKFEPFALVLPFCPSALCDTSFTEVHKVIHFLILFHSLRALATAHALVHKLPCQTVHSPSSTRPCLLHRSYLKHEILRLQINLEVKMSS